LRPANSPKGLPLLTLLGFGLGLCLRELKPGPTIVYPLLLPWWQLCSKCPPLPQPQHTGSRLPTTTVSDIVGRSAVVCWHRCLISANSSRTKLVVKLVGLSAAAVTTCTADLADDDLSTSVTSTCCTVTPGRHVLSAWKYAFQSLRACSIVSTLATSRCCFRPRLLIDWWKASSARLCRLFAGKSS